MILAVKMALNFSLLAKGPVYIMSQSMDRQNGFYGSIVLWLFSCSNAAMMHSNPSPFPPPLLARV